MSPTTPESRNSPPFIRSSSHTFLLPTSQTQTEPPQQQNHHNFDVANRLSIVIPHHLSSSSTSGTLGFKSFLFAPFATCRIIIEAREERSLITPSSVSPGHRLDLPLLGEMKWERLKVSAKDWMRNPKNLALLLWGTAVGVSGAMLFLVMVGWLDNAIHEKSKRDAMFEANNQVLNALFTLMCLYLHPQRLLHLFLLYRWHPDDIKHLRQIYCKDGKYKPHEWSNMLVVVLLLNINCFAQYALCGLNWAYKRADRPVIGVALCLAIAIGAPAIAGIYTIVSPLGKDYVEDEGDLEEREKEQTAELSQKPSFKIGKAWKLSKKPTFTTTDGSAIENPQWFGGLFDIKKDSQVALITFFCGFCVFGWNMERLGFGNRFVHTVTFILLCTAPYWIFFLAATNIDNPLVRHGLSYGGMVLCFFGLLYGGFWRIRMRKTYNLPAQTWCFGKASLTDCTQWLFCCLCSLCQEVRTSESYKIRDSKFYERHSCITPEGSFQYVSSPPSSDSPLSHGNILVNGHHKCSDSVQGSEKVVEAVELHPPEPLEIQNRMTSTTPPGPTTGDGEVNSSPLSISNE